MTSAITHTGEAREDCQVVIFHRFCAISGSGAASPVTKEGNLITQSNVSSISVKIFDSTETQISTTLTPTAASTVFDTLQTTLTWGNIPDKLGGNFRYVIPAAYQASGDVTQYAEVLVTLTDGTVLPAVWSYYVKKLMGS